MRRAPRMAAGLAALLLASAPCAAVPDFVPTSGKIFEEYHAMDQPRTDVPVGALWIQNYGPTGEGAASDNLETIKSLTGVAINNDLQLSLTAGLFTLFGLDPSYKNRVTARFTDVTIVRVKDMAKLSGPPEEPRIYEALKAGTITITTDNSIGLDFDAGARAHRLPVVGRADTGRNKSLTIDGRDMFIAYRVATMKAVRGEAEEVRVRAGDDGADAEVGDYRIVVDTAELEKCMAEAGAAEQAKACEADKGIGLSVLKADAPAANPAGSPAAIYNLAKDMGQAKLLPLPVPVADGKGGLFTSLLVQPDLDYVEAKRNGSAKGGMSLSAKSRVTATLRGTRLDTLRNPQAVGW